MSSPLQYLDASSIVFAVISVIFSTEPPTESFSSNGALLSFAFCVDEGTTPFHIFLANIAFYLFWGVAMVVVSHPKSWRVIRTIPYSCIALLPKKKENGQNPRNQRAASQPIPPAIECRGRLVLDFAITVCALAVALTLADMFCNPTPQVYNAVLLLLVRSTSCVTLEGFDDQGGENRWYFDGRVICFREGTFDGRWQIASVVFVAVCDFHSRQSIFYS